MFPMLAALELNSPAIWICVLGGLAFFLLGRELFEKKTAIDDFQADVGELIPKAEKIGLSVITPFLKDIAYGRGIVAMRTHLRALRSTVGDGDQLKKIWGDIRRKALADAMADPMERAELFAAISKQAQVVITPVGAPPAPTQPVATVTPTEA